MTLFTVGLHPLKLDELKSPLPMDSECFRNDGMYERLGGN
jgi:hypothetical protein